jgi:hypothetical protein
MSNKLWLFAALFLLIGPLSADDFRVLETTGTTNVTLGQALKAGDRITTGRDGRVQFASPAGTILHVGPSSVLEVEDDSLFHRLYVKTGRLFGKFASVKKDGERSFRVRTPVIVCAVRGTELAVDVSSSAEVQAGVQEGEVEVVPVEPSTSTITETTVSTTPVTEPVVVLSSGIGVIARAHEPIVKILEIPPLLVSSADWFKSIREQVPSLRERYKEFNKPAKIQPKKIDLPRPK